LKLNTLKNYSNGSYRRGTHRDLAISFSNYKQGIDNTAIGERGTATILTMLFQTEGSSWKRRFSDSYQNNEKH
jgi:hypothetical protein